MNILILEDEIPAYNKLLGNLEAYFPNSITTDWARNIKDGKVFIENNNYDLILSDIQLLDGIAFELFNQVAINCPIIFCSAYNDYLFQAFNTNGIAYILKPYTINDFTKALDKYKTLFRKDEYVAIDTKILNKLKAALKEESSNFKKRFVIKKPKGIQLLQVSDITMIEASGDFCIAYDNSGLKHVISQAIGSISQQVSPQVFYKINRSQLVNIEYITNMESYFKNRLLLTIQGVKEKVMTSTSITPSFRKWIE